MRALRVFPATVLLLSSWACGGRTMWNEPGNDAGGSATAGTADQGAMPGAGRSNAGGAFAASGFAGVAGFEPYRPGCRYVTCAALDCPYGYAEPLPNDCCLSCAASEACQQQRDDYLAFERQQVEKYSNLGCMVDSDCVIYYRSNFCDTHCDFIVPAAAVSSLEDILQGYADTNCSPDCPLTRVSCSYGGGLRCIAGRCQ